jgi:hypothetical protein
MTMPPDSSGTISSGFSVLRVLRVLRGSFLRPRVREGAAPLNL